MSDDQFRETISRVVDALNREREAVVTLGYTTADIVIELGKIREYLGILVGREHLETR